MHSLNRLASLVCAILAATAGVAIAHSIDIEPQQELRGAWRANFPWYADPSPLNFSVRRPYDLTQEWPVIVAPSPETGEPEYQVNFETGTPAWLGGVYSSRAILGYLDGAPLVFQANRDIVG